MLGCCECCDGRIYHIVFHLFYRFASEDCESCNAEMAETILKVIGILKIRLQKRFYECLHAAQPGLHNN